MLLGEIASKCQVSEIMIVSSMISLEQIELIMRLCNIFDFAVNYMECDKVAIAKVVDSLTHTMPAKLNKISYNIDMWIYLE